MSHNIKDAAPFDDIVVNTYQIKMSHNTGVMNNNSRYVMNVLQIATSHNAA
ncbi:hypothetical protein T190115A13A_270002 [Tenacibaculum sp. 190524A02b]|uniref:Uncharacterized protein n=1 Tax=Tenacibaculum vairaonense TaxID=3137860 RepID=A0ABM9PLR7_9FLAO